MQAFCRPPSNRGCMIESLILFPLSNAVALTSFPTFYSKCCGYVLLLKGRLYQETDGAIEVLLIRDGVSPC
jgi:hypothetical protein